MSDRSSRRWDFAAGGLLLTGLVVALAVFSHDPSGTPDVRYPPPPPTNLLGPAGAALAGGLRDALGVAVYLLLASWFVLVLLLFLRRGLLTWFLRLAGWLLLLPCAAVLAHRLSEPGPGAPVAGHGGTLGAWLSLALRDHLRPAGEVAVLCGCALLGLVLTADFALAYLLRAGWAGCRRLSSSAAAFVRWLGSEREARPGPAPLRVHTPPAEPDAARDEPADRDIPIRHHDQAAPEAAAPPPIVRPRPASEAEAARFAGYELPPLTLLEDAEPFDYDAQDHLLRERAALLEKTCADFGVRVRVVGINTGPVITQFELALETGLRVHKVTQLADDLAVNLKVPSVRVVAPIPGKNTVGVEVPNEQRATVRLKEVILTAGKKAAKSRIPLFLGKDTEGRPLVHDLAEMPHLLIAGSTGTGKSVCINVVILSMLLTRRPDELKLLLLDPKQVELNDYARIPHLMHPVIKDVKKMEAVLAWAVDKMEERYDLLSRARARSIAAYNELAPAEIRRRVQPADEDEAARIPERMPYIVIVVDEVGDLMMQMKKEVEGHIIRLSQKSRAAGIHLVLATQKPTVDVITGLIKSNLPARVCFRVVNRSDSRVVLDEMGADKLLGKGDMLFLQPGTSTLMRAQGTYVGGEEIERVAGHLECDEPCYAEELMRLKTSDRDGPGTAGQPKREDEPLYDAAVEVVVREGRGSVSLLQRALGIGYGRAARLIDYMAEDGIVGAYNGSSAREVLYTPEQWEALKKTG